jgi:hypothetical protein
MNLQILHELVAKLAHEMSKYLSMNEYTNGQLLGL